jgi:hypothetical protein
VSQRILQSYWDRWICFRGLIDTAESASTVSLRPPNPNFYRHSFVLKKLPFCVKIMLLNFFWILQSHWNRQSLFCGLIEAAKAASKVSLKPPNLLPRPHWNRGSRQFQTIILNFSAILKPYAKQLWSVNQGPRGCWLMKKTEGGKSRETVPLIVDYRLPQKIPTEKY